MVRMVRSLADRTFQLCPRRQKRGPKSASAWGRHGRPSRFVLYGWKRASKKGCESETRSDLTFRFSTSFQIIFVFSSFNSLVFSAFKHGSDSSCFSTVVRFHKIESFFNLFASRAAISSLTAKSLRPRPFVNSTGQRPRPFSSNETLFFRSAFFRRPDRTSYSSHFYSRQLGTAVWRDVRP